MTVSERELGLAVGLYYPPGFSASPSRAIRSGSGPRFIGVYWGSGAPPAAQVLQALAALVILNTPRGFGDRAVAVLTLPARPRRGSGVTGTNGKKADVVGPSSVLKGLV